MLSPRTVAPWAAAVALLAGPPLAAAKPPTAGEAAPDFHVTTFDGHQYTLADFRGQVLVINLWATWCVPCKRELPLLNGFLRATQDKGLRVLALATENSVPPYQLNRLASVLTIPLVRNMKGPYAVLKGVPTNYVIDRAGVVRYAQAGALTLDDLNRVLVPLLNEPAPGPAPEGSPAVSPGASPP